MSRVLEALPMEVNPPPHPRQPLWSRLPVVPSQGGGSTLADRTLLAGGPVSFWAANPFPLVSGCQAQGQRTHASSPTVTPKPGLRL